MAETRVDEKEKFNYLAFRWSPTISAHALHISVASLHLEFVVFLHIWISWAHSWLIIVKLIPLIEF